MMRVVRSFFVSVLALVCVHCSLLLYNDDELTSTPAPDASNDSGADGASSNPPNDATTSNDAGNGADAKSFPDSAVVWIVNGHAYEVVAEPAGILWATAKVAAENRGGHLVTITSDEENAFAYQVASANDAAWLNDEGTIFGPFIGLSQPNGSPEPDGGFAWVTGEPLGYLNWGEGQPDNAGNEGIVHFFAGNEKGPEWNDNAATEPLKGYVVEYE